MDNLSSVTVSLPLNSTMRSEAEFVEQAELARSSLQQFAAVKDFNNADELKISALHKLIKTTVILLFSYFSSFSKLFLASV